jgi:peptidoglycan/xylan/chitin deacetylase (PgdA/CDA1 family)
MSCDTPSRNVAAPPRRPFGRCVLGTEPSPSALRQLVREGLGRVLPRRYFAIDGPSRRSIYLTFDDGPHPEHTPRLLDALGALGIPATFFVVGERAERHTDLLRRMAAEGHEIGHHSWSHGEPRATTAATLVAEAERGRLFLRTQAGVDSRLFRPPKGEVTLTKLLALWRAGYSVTLWSTDPRDYAARSGREVEAFFENQPLKGGEIVLLHDRHPHAASALPTIAREACGRGLAFSTITAREARR